MKTYFSFALVFIYTCAIAQDKPQSYTPERVIEVVFEALSEGNVKKMEQVVTPDLRILENGVVWNLDTVRRYLSKPRPADFNRVNSFEFFQSEVAEKMAFVSYHNSAIIHANNKDRTIQWLESAVLIRQEDGWKLKMLHSTRLEQH